MEEKTHITMQQKDFKIKNKGQARLFKSDFMEALSKSHPAVIFSMYIPIITYMIYYGIKYKDLTATRTILVFLAGILFWTFFEYLMHRFLFHCFSKNKTIQKITYKIHGVHHEYPRDKERLFMPPVPSILIASAIFGLQYLLLSWNVLAFFPGFMFGYLLYGSMHYAIHAFKPPKFMKALWRNHHLHHYKYPELGFGVSSTLWDYVFGTMTPKK